MTPGELFQAGQLREAVSAATDGVKQSPSDGEQRAFLALLLCFSGQWQRAAQQLEVVQQQDPKKTYGALAMRRLIQAEQARLQFFATGAMPQFFDRPTPAMEFCLRATIALRENAASEAATLVNQAESVRVPVPGRCNEQTFADLRDLDDVTAPFFEVFTGAGQYAWVAMESVASLEFKRPERARDLLWRQVALKLREGAEMDVYLPVLYAGTAELGDEQLQLGRASDWKNEVGTPVRGIGQRMFLVGDSSKAIVELQRIEFQV